ncbi:hypothetical protein NH340_JMT04747 [Sarcoptes scabiei]|nr:hypothetical protein NH340_JMT04747 [Sarcoptes scabiei]
MKNKTKQKQSTNVRLRRTDPNQSLGFSIRGDRGNETFQGLARVANDRISHRFVCNLQIGWEYGIGFYISDVQPNSLAAQQGLCPGDQIFRINGFPLDRVIHDEVVSLIRMSSNDLTLRVRSVGVVPSASSLTTPSSTISSVSDDHLSSSDELIHLPLLSSSTLQEQKDSSPIMTNEYPQQQQQQQQQPIQNSHSFHQLSPSGPNDYPLSPTCSTPPSSSSTLIQSSIESMRHCDEKKLCLQGHRPGSSLGFSVVNGPINCPGIFVQNVKDGKLAQKCGLEIGDQIVRVNDHDVSIIGFDGAIAILKSTTNINLIVRKGVARHIFEWYVLIDNRED